MRRYVRHGMSRTKLYQVWKAMKARCHRKSHSAYSEYGGRDIRVCRAWHDPEIFFKWAEKGYRKGLTLDRKDNNKGYSPSNCHWITIAQQLRNMRGNVWVKYNGKKMILADAAILSGLNRNTIKRRMRVGWPEENWFD